MTHLLEVINLRKSYGDFVAVRGISFTVARGEVFGLLGPNGAGKSTSMMMISGLLPASGGTIRIDGLTLDPSNRDLRRRLGIVPQELAIYPDLTAQENMEFFGRLYGVRGTALTRKVDEILDRVGLTDRATDPVDEFSGGMQRRLNFAVALLHEPELLILDEPTVGIDPQSRTHLLNCVRDLQAQGLSVIYASHYMEEVEAICERVAIVDAGEILVCDTLENLLGRTTGEVRVVVSGDQSALADPALVQDHWTVTPGENISTILMRRSDSLHEQLDTTLHSLRERGLELVALTSQNASLERLFLDLTGRGLRD